MKNGNIKIGSNKYKLNYTPRELKDMEIEFKRETASHTIRPLTTYFAEASLRSKDFKNKPKTLDLLIRWYNKRTQHLLRLGQAYVFGQSVKSVLFHKGQDEVEKKFTDLENKLLNYIVKISRGNITFIEFYPGFILKITEEGKVSWIFDYKQNIRNY